MSDLYRVMMNMDAWKDLERYAEAERMKSVERSDMKSAANLTLSEICEERGIRKGMQKLIQYALQKGEGI